MKRIVYALLGVAVLAVAGFLIARALQSSLVYFILPSEYARDAASFDGKRVRLGGLVQAGSVVYDDAKLHLTFQITDGIKDYPVRYDGAPPDLFQENGGVVIEGRFHDDVFVGDNLLVKHSENYHPPAEGEPIDVEALKESLR
ncbi:MAG: cytochrome c maturation protein CcmE [Trueperaceae bacterium]|nr:cytochrome c maturation protein CcmE [Trueperaceae bacterium]